MKDTAIEVIQNKIYKESEISDCAASWRNQQNKVVFTNGVFDILHIGHITYLAQASDLGDKLIIGLNADLSVKRLKGNDRPINTEKNRAQLLAALAFVDAVVIFEDDTPKQLIKLLLPDVLVKGADYHVDAIVGAKEVVANGGVVKTIDFVEGHSSTLLINRINLS